MATETTPDTIITERVLSAAQEVVFRAWADEDERRQWDVPGSDWVLAEFSQDFRVDGIERALFGPPGEPAFESLGRYLVIEPPHQIVSAGTMRAMQTGTVTSATMLTVALTPTDDGTRVTLIDQSVFLGESETAQMRRRGWNEILDRLEHHLAAAAGGAHGIH